MKVFLGGTCNGSKWRDRLIPMLKIDYFNPVVDDWTPECMAEEIRQRELCDYCLYVITPMMTGVYAIAEAVDDSNKRPDKTIFCILENDTFNQGGVEITKQFTDEKLKSLHKAGYLIVKNGAILQLSLLSVASLLNEGA